MARTEGDSDGLPKEREKSEKRTISSGFPLPRSIHSLALAYVPSKQPIKGQNPGVWPGFSIVFHGPRLGGTVFHWLAAPIANWTGKRTSI